jgi:hypothetical protein
MYLTTLEYPCAHCDEGAWTQDVDEDGKAIGTPSGDCGCSADGHSAALQAAWDVFCDQAQENRYQDGPADTSSSYIQALRDSGRYR